MKSQQTITTLIVNDEFELSIAEISTQCQLPEEILIELVELGLFNQQTSVEALRFDADKLSRVQSAARLFHGLKINPSGVVLALELLDEIEALRQELSILQRLS